ncbi:LamG-like jellyroll fold domain-containing protein [Bacteroidota bacterium]
MRPVISFQKQTKKSKYCISAIIILLFLLSSCEKSTEPDNTPPTVTITAPIDGSYVSELAKITCVATDTKGIDKVSLWVDGIPIEGAEDNSEPYELVWNTTYYENLSAHTITIRATDKNGNKTDSDPIILLVDNRFSYPTKLNITSIVYDNNSFIIKWQKSPDLDFYSYTLYQALSPDMSDGEEIFMSNNVNDTTFSVSNVTKNEIRFYLLVVEDALSFITQSDVYPASSSAFYAYYPFNGNANDLSGNNYNGISHGITYANDRYGTENSAAYFSGFAWIQLPDIIRFQPLKSATISFWLKTSKGSRFDIIDQRSSSGYNFGIIYNYVIGGYKRLEFNYPGYHPNLGGEGNYPIYENVDNNEWQHFVFVKETIQGRYSIYINGDLHSELILGDVGFSVNGHLLIGKNWVSTGYYTGLLDDIYLFDRALSEQEIKNLYEE